MFTNLAKAVVGVVVEVPVSVVRDTITLCGAFDGNGEPHTTEALRKVADNIKTATEPEERG